MKASALSFVLAAAAMPLQAGSRSSASYAVPADVVSAGGAPSTSAVYKNEGSAGGVSGTATAPSPPLLNEAGFMAQLQDMAGLTLTAAALTVNEGGTRQLGALLTVNGITATVAAGDVAWSILAGPLSIDPSGLTT